MEAVAWLCSCSMTRLLMLFSLYWSNFGTANVDIGTTNCDAVKYAYGSKDGFSSSDVPFSKIEGSHLQICSRDLTCCTRDMESKLNAEAKAEFNKIVDNMVGLLHTTFMSRTNKFDTFFTELLDNSKEDLHNMFLRTYGILYQQNSEIFMDLFRDLRAYYKGHDMNLLDVLDKFFSDLLEKMFVLLHAQYVFNDNYLECITDHMNELKPFGDVPSKMSIQVKRSFIAARTFVQGLAVGRDVINAVSKMEMTGSCKKAITKMRYCSYCSGVPYNKPCNNYCMNVMKGCLANYADLNKDWNTYIDALKNLSERLGGPFNIEAVVDPIDVKISDAIMNFQEGSEVITNKVFQGCGRPPYARRKREAASSYDEFAYGWNKDRKYYVRPTTAAGTSLDRLVRDIEEKISTTRDFFKNMPNAICNDMAAQMFEEDNCWNGMSVNRYLPDVMKDGVQSQINNPEVDVDVRKTNFVISQQILQLKLISNKLKNAYDGIDVDWIDTADVIDDGSADGSGSGSGSGGGTYVFNDDKPLTDWPQGRGPDVGFPGYKDSSHEKPDNTYQNNADYDIIFDPNEPTASSSHVACSVTSLILVLLLTFSISRWRHS